MATDSTTSVLLCGVGGQGVLLVSELVALAAIEAGHDAKQTEVHGVSQRGGSVHSHVRFGPRVHSPLIPAGAADVVIGMEKLEALRFAHFLRDGGIMLVNDFEVAPVSGGPQAVEAYPHEALRFLKQKGLNVVAVTATDLAATELGETRAANVLMLGLLSTQLSLPPDAWARALAGRIPERFRALNERAFELGASLAADGVPTNHSLDDSSPSKMGMSD